MRRSLALKTASDDESCAGYLDGNIPNIAGNRGYSANFLFLPRADSPLNLAELTNLKELQLYKTQVSDEQVQKLRQALPNCKIEK